MSRRVVPVQFRLTLAAVAMLSLVRMPVYVLLATASTKPELPRIYVDTTYVPPSGRRIAVPAGGDFQAALNAAQAGDVIALEAGATFTGPFMLPNKPGIGWITIRTSAPDTGLPGPEIRVDPSYAQVMPKLVAGSGSIITTAPGAHHYRFIGIEIRPREGVVLHDLVQLGSNERSIDQLSHHIIFDRCYIHGNPVGPTQRGILMNSASTAVIDSYLAGFKKADQDTQAIYGFNGPGPFKIVNDYLEAAGENVMFGGWYSTIPNVVPSDIEIRGNYFFKPLSWRVGDPTYAGTPWSVKNLFELKSAARVLVDGNVFENIWAADQNGAAIQFTPRNPGPDPWAIVEDVTFTHNIIRHATAGIHLLGADNNQPSQQLQRVLIQNNLFIDIGAFPGGINNTIPGRLVQLQDGGVNGVWIGTANVVIDHNTAFQTECPAYANVYRGAPHTGFVFTNNITLNNLYGVSASGILGNALGALNTYFPGYVFARNVLPSGNPSSYPAGNFFPATLDRVGFVNYAGGDYHLAASSPYKKAGTDGKDIGADIDALSTAIASWWRTATRP